MIAAKYHEISSTNGNFLLNLSPDLHHEADRCSADYMECEHEYTWLERKETTTNNTTSLNSDLLLLADALQGKDGTPLLVTEQKPGQTLNYSQTPDR
jgi:hypothetical protein